MEDYYKYEHLSFEVRSDLTVSVQCNQDWDFMNVEVKLKYSLKGLGVLD